MDLTKTEAARRAGVSRRTWHEIEEGQRATSSAETLAQFDQVLGFPEGTLFGMTARSEHLQVESLRQRAIAMVRLMSTDELQVFVESHGAETVQALLAKLEADIAGLRREVVGTAGTRRSTPSSRANGARSA